jgi:hypothetical protein
MAKNTSKIEIDNHGRGLLINIISKSISNDRELTPDDISKLKEIKKALQGLDLKPEMFLRSI